MVPQHIFMTMYLHEQSANTEFSALSVSDGPFITADLVRPKS